MGTNRPRACSIDISADFLSLDCDLGFIGGLCLVLRVCEGALA